MWPQIVTRGGLYRAFYDRLSDPPALLDDYAREVLFQRAAADAVASGDAPPFEVRPGLIPQMLSLYDALRRQHIDDAVFSRALKSARRRAGIVKAVSAETRSFGLSTAPLGVVRYTAARIAVHGSPWPKGMSVDRATGTAASRRDATRQSWPCSAAGTSARD